MLETSRAAAQRVEKDAALDALSGEGGPPRTLLAARRSFSSLLLGEFEHLVEEHL
jgi:hypothetical protein